ncbi:MAG: GNAT family N-acetyltransferase [Bacteroidota bacterium]
MSVTSIHEQSSRSRTGLALIRPVQPADREPLRTLLVETEVFSGDEVGIAIELIDAVLLRSDQKDYIIHVYDDGESVLGYYCIGPTPATSGTFDLYWIAVKPDMHGRGIGGMLNSHAEETICSMGGRLVIAETSSQPKYDKTRKFYVTHGYSELSRIKDYYKIGDDLVVYGKYLTR